jgi:hypothetical protein
MSRRLKGDSSNSGSHRLRRKRQIETPSLSTSGIISTLSSIEGSSFGLRTNHRTWSQTWVTGRVVYVLYTVETEGLGVEVVVVVFMLGPPLPSSPRRLRSRPSY